MKFFYGGKNDDFLTKLKLLGLNGDMQKFGEFLTSDYCARTLRENKLTIHIEIDSIYYENFNTNESFYDYIFVQQDANKKTLKTKFSFSRNFNQYIREFQVGIKAQDEDKYDMLTNKNSKFLFYRFNDFLQMRNQDMRLIRYSIIVQDQEALVEL